MDKLTISHSPHVHGRFSTRSLMKDVLIALVPAVIMAVAFYGWAALKLLVISVAGCVAIEYLIGRFLLKSPGSISDLSAVVTGVLLALNLPSSAPWWIPLVGAVLAIGVAKMTFGGLGQNLYNPALVARVFLLMSFPVIMTNWTLTEPLVSCTIPWLQGQVDAFTGATPLGLVSEGLKSGIAVPEIMQQGQFTWQQLLLVSLGGSMGEVSSLALLLGFVYLLFRRVIRPTIPVVVVATVAVLTLIFSLINPARFTGPVFNIFTGGLLLGAIFMATDYVTSPMSFKGQVIYAVGIGAISVFIRYFGSYPEGVSFSILIMNSAVPLLNKYCKPRRFAGEVRNG